MLRRNTRAATAKETSRGADVAEGPEAMNKTDQRACAGARAAWSLGRIAMVLLAALVLSGCMHLRTDRSAGAPVWSNLAPAPDQPRSQRHRTDARGEATGRVASREPDPARAKPEIAEETARPARLSAPPPPDAPALRIARAAATAPAERAAPAEAPPEAPAPSPRPSLTARSEPLRVGPFQIAARLRTEIAPPGAPPAIGPVSASPAALVPPVSRHFKPETRMTLCPGFRRRNVPRLGAAREILSYRPFIRVRGKLLATTPVRGVCVTSGFGRRWGRLHKGVDYAPRKRAGRPPRIYAAADGVVREVRYYRGYGRTVVIEHGDGVFTRYAHLSRFAFGLREGRRVRFGRPLGRMGRSGRRRMGVHLHYEVLTGRYHETYRAFALKGNDPLGLPGVRSAPRPVLVAAHRPRALDALAKPVKPRRAPARDRAPIGGRAGWRNDDA